MESRSGEPFELASNEQAGRPTGGNAATDAEPMPATLS
jgi:hypothetical protein